VHVETRAEVLRLRGVLRDLVALSAVPTVWIGRDPSAVAAGLADALMGLLQLGFAFVRLSDPGGPGGVHGRGFRNGWNVTSLRALSSRVRRSFPTSAEARSRAAALPSRSESMARTAWSLPPANAAIFRLL
jgi:hypothetical protein